MNRIPQAWKNLRSAIAQVVAPAGFKPSDVDVVRQQVERREVARVLAFRSLAAATKGTALEGQQTRQVFEAVDRAMSTLGKSSAEPRLPADTPLFR